jgi:hypothetical protein
MDAPDAIIRQSAPLRVMAALSALPRDDASLDFARLKALTGASDGNLGAHLGHLARAGYVAVDKRFAGRAAFARHVAFLRKIIARL